MNYETNQDIQRLEQMLDEATATGAPVARIGNATEGVPYSDPSCRVDAEIASLRWAWLAFRQLAEAADESLPAMPDLTASMVPRKARQRRLPGLIAAIAVLAAGLLVAFSLGGWIARDNKQIENESAAAQSAVPEDVKSAATRQELPKVASTQIPKSKDKKSKSAASMASAWDDPLETQITSVSQEVQDVEQNWQHRVDDVDLVQYRIDEVSDSLQNDAL